MLTLVQKENEKDQADIFQDTYFEKIQIIQLTIIYCFKNINHDNPANFLL